MFSFVSFQSPNFFKSFGFLSLGGQTSRLKSTGNKKIPPFWSGPSASIMYSNDFYKNWNEITLNKRAYNYINVQHITFPISGSATGRKILQCNDRMNIIVIKNTHKAIKFSITIYYFFCAFKIKDSCIFLVTMYNLIQRKIRIVGKQKLWYIFFWKKRFFELSWDPIANSVPKTPKMQLGSVNILRRKVNINTN